MTDRVFLDWTYLLTRCKNSKERIRIEETGVLVEEGWKNYRRATSDGCLKKIARQKDKEE